MLFVKVNTSHWWIWWHRGMELKFIHSP